MCVSSIFLVLLLLISLSDPDFKGGINLGLHNYGDTTIELKAGQSYAQFIPLRYYHGPVFGAGDFNFRTERGEGSFGSTEARLRLEGLLTQHFGHQEAPADGRQEVPDNCESNVGVNCVEEVLRSDSDFN